MITSNSEERKIKHTETQYEVPLTTLQNVRYGHTKERVRKLANSYIVKLKPTAIPLTIKKTNLDEEQILMIKPVLPLGRYLSTVAIKSMEARLDEVKPVLDSILYKY
ncbi:hypothetical protein ABW636_00290 [Aquimarina sp. 2201CG1-2-11]|uniref:hypothetical protein n=1 Tax=Aquimarina discodermiae TaxID=3231043 RepID=UPI00346221D0